MSANRGKIVVGALVTGSLTVLLGLAALIFFPEASRPLAMPAQAQPAALPVFCAPSHVPAGENWILLGSFKDLPQDLVVTPAAVGVVVLETQKISKKAVGARVQVAFGASGKLLRVSSVLAASETYPDVYHGPIPESRTQDANFSPDQLVDGQLVVDGKHFMYGYHPAGESPLAALRVHNRSTGEWHRHEHAVEKARAAEEVKVPDPPHFVEVNVFETLPDTDGNGIPDFADVEEPKVLRQEQLGVELRPQGNVLDIVAVDESGFTSWRTLNVYSSYVPAE